MRTRKGGRDAANEREMVRGVQRGQELNGSGVHICTEQNGFRAGDGVERKVGMWMEGDGDRTGDGKGRAGKRG